jgi:hypothetical protein
MSTGIVSMGRSQLRCSLLSRTRQIEFRWRSQCWRELVAIVIHLHTYESTSPIFSSVLCNMQTSTGLMFPGPQAGLGPLRGRKSFLARQTAVDNRRCALNEEQPLGQSEGMKYSLPSKTFVILPIAIAAIVASLFSTGCASKAPFDSSGASSASTSDPPTFVVSEFKVESSSQMLPSGEHNITVSNIGGAVHELVFVKANSVSVLPTKPDGSVDEDKIADADKVGEIEGIAVGSTKSKSFNLTPGTYVAFCNLIDNSEHMTGNKMMAGSATMMGTHVHFALGMSKVITVK